MAASPHGFAEACRYVKPVARLSLRTLKHVPESVRRPTFDVTRLQPGILHLGCGVFHRAHQALFTQRAIEFERTAEPGAWGIIGASLVTPTLRDALKPQDGLYTLLERGTDSIQAEVIGTLRDISFVPEDPAALFARFADPAIHIVTLTVTAEAYCLDPNTGRLCTNHPSILRDLRSCTPSSAVGVLVKGLAASRAAGRPPPVILSCDNLPANGRMLRQAAVDYAALYNDSLSAWIDNSVQFPCTMVDRIVPTSTETDRQDAAGMLKLEDATPVSAEPYRQWVIERFEGPRPRWEAVGAEFVSDVEVWETSKLRLLNGTHMAIAYLGSLIGLETVADFVSDPVRAAYTAQFMLREQMPTLSSSGHDIPAYAHQLLGRWRNPAVAHQLSRIARNGSQKLAARLLVPLRENLQAGRPAPCTFLAIAAWIRCTTGYGLLNGGRHVRDPLAEHMRRVGEAAGGNQDRLLASVLQLEEVFGKDLPHREPFRAGLSKALDNLQRQGTYAAIAACLV
jgi:fructuronate reductase